MGNNGDTLGIILGIAGLVVSVISIILAYIFYQRSLRLKEPFWCVRSNNLITGYSSKLSNLEVLYKSQKVENLTVSKVLFWNNGSEVIKDEDVARANPLRIVGLNEVKLLDTKLLTSNNDSSQFSVKLMPDGNCAYINFDYLDKGQGGVIQVVHTGTTSEDIKVIGDIKGARELREEFPRPSLKSRDGFILAFIPVMFGMMGLLMTLVGVTVAFTLLSSPISNIGVWFYALLPFIGGIFIIRKAIVFLRLPPLIPKGLEIFRESMPRFRKTTSFLNLGDD